MTVSEGEMGKCELDLVGLQEVKGGTEPAGDMFFCRTWLMKYYGTGICPVIGVGVVLILHGYEVVFNVSFLVSGTAVHKHWMACCRN
jgi:hypothetical protein